MSLDWNATKVENLDELHASGEHEAERTAHLCFLLMAVGVGSITKANYAEVASRIRLYESVKGALWTSSPEQGKRIEHPYTTADIKARIGYRTNVSNQTQAQWLKRFFETIVEETAYQSR